MAESKTERTMELLLWRHADAEDGIPDAGRALTKKGLKQAKQVAQWLKPRLPGDCLILVSPAMRAQQTAAALDPAIHHGAAHWRTGGNCRPHRRQQLAGARGHGGSCRPPALRWGGQLAARLLCGERSNWNIKKGALWWFSSRTGYGETQTTLRAVVSPDLLLRTGCKMNFAAARSMGTRGEVSIQWGEVSLHFETRCQARRWVLALLQAALAAASPQRLYFQAQPGRFPFFRFTGQRRRAQGVILQQGVRQQQAKAALGHLAAECGNSRSVRLRQNRLARRRQNTSAQSPGTGFRSWSLASLPRCASTSCANCDCSMREKPGMSGIGNDIGRVLVVPVVGYGNADLVQGRGPGKRLSCMGVGLVLVHLPIQPPRQFGHALGLSRIDVIAAHELAHRCFAHVVLLHAAEQVVQHALAQRRVRHAHVFDAKLVKTRRT